MKECLREVKEAVLGKEVYEYEKPPSKKLIRHLRKNYNIEIVIFREDGTCEVIKKK